ncbi:MAG: hypothetical protein AB7E79_12735 [Rhodospirillaceae bacterium]
MKTIHVFTVAAANYLPKARVLLTSLRRQHPDWRLHFAVCDAPPPAEALAGLGADEVHQLDSLEIPNLRRWAFCHSLIELATAIKPFVLKKLLARADCAAAVYLDPDIAVLSPMSDVEDALHAADIVLTPHLTDPERAVPGIVANEISTMQHGIYNLGFIGVAARDEGRRFAAWWSERTYRYCREDIPDGIYTDQRWVDFAPAFFDKVKVLRTPGLNAAPWNLPNRNMAGGFERGFTVNGQPLVFFHFSQLGVMPDARTTGGQSAAAELVEWYRRETMPTAGEKAVSAHYAYDRFADGSPIAAEQRLVYRARPDVQRAHPDPFAHGDGSYAAWWKAHARTEYPRLFNPATKPAEMQQLQAFLTYRRDGEDIVGDDAVAPAAVYGGAMSKVASFIRKIAR